MRFFHFHGSLFQRLCSDAVLVPMQTTQLSRRQWNVSFDYILGTLADTVYELLVTIFDKLFLCLLSQSLYSLKYR